MSRLRFPNHNLVGSRGGGLSVVSSSGELSSLPTLMGV